MGPFLPPWLLEHPAGIDNQQWLVTRFAGFIVLAYVVGKFLIPALRARLDQRREQIEQMRDEVQRTLRDLSETRDQYKQRLGQIAEETQRRLDAAVREASVLRQHIEEEAYHMAQAIIAHASREVERDREKAMAHLRMEFADDVVEAARHAASRTLTAERQSQLVAAFLAEMERLP